MFTPETFWTVIGVSVPFHKKAALFTSEVFFGACELFTTHFMYKITQLALLLEYTKSPRGAFCNKIFESLSLCPPIPLPRRHREFLTGVRTRVNDKSLSFTPSWSLTSLAETKLLTFNRTRVSHEEAFSFEGASAVSLFLHEGASNTESDRFSLS